MGQKVVLAKPVEDFIIKNMIAFSETEEKTYYFLPSFVRNKKDPELVYDLASDIVGNANRLIEGAMTENERGKVSDGYHTFNELYDHRIILFIQLCKAMKLDCWASAKHSDGSIWDGWFLLGLYKEKGKQITYHLPIKYWSEVCDFAEILEQAPEFDGHTSTDVLNRLKLL